MRKVVIIFLLTLTTILLVPPTITAQNTPAILKQVPATEVSDKKLWSDRENRKALIKAIDRSLDYLRTDRARRAYENYPIKEISRDRVRRSLIRFRELLLKSKSKSEFQKAIAKEFVFYRSVGDDEQGRVKFTGYFEPIYKASRQRNAEYKYSLYRKPSNFSRWSQPHPTRIQLEGDDGLLGDKSILKGNELVWLKDRLEAYLVQVQGSAKLLLPDGKLISVGFDGNTNYPYRSIGKEMIKDGIFPPDGLTLPMVLEYLRANPEELKNYLPRNDRFIFFRETHGAPPLGSIGVPVTAERLIATDKSIMPPGALALIRTQMPDKNLNLQLVERFVLDQDTGSAIIGPGRVDIFMGTGQLAGERAGLINTPGELYYLLLKN
jgi:membrane-bound lytic murein transglycosylase A